MSNKFWLGFVAVFVALVAMDAVINTMLMKGDYEATAALWRPEAEMKIWIFQVVSAFVAFFFTLIFSKGYEGGGLMEGVRYGFYVGMMMAVPMAYGSYGAMPIPYGFALKWFVFGMLEYIVAGIILAAIYGKEAQVTKVQKTA
jgi:hypothetical protein